MPKLTPTRSQRQTQKNKKILSQNYIQLQNLIISTTHEITQTIREELAQNPALELYEEPFIYEDIERNDDKTENWNQDFDKPYDEYETGEPIERREIFDGDAKDLALGLEQAAIEYAGDDPQSLVSLSESINFYRTTGALPSDANKKLQDDLRILEKSISDKSLPSESPTFEVYEESGNVQSVLIQTIADSLIYRNGFGKYSDKAKEFIDRINARFTSLSNLATIIFEKIQGDFFRQSDLKNALLSLVPLSTKNLSDLEMEFSLKIDKKLISKLSDLLVSCKFGLFPLGFFMPSKAALLRLWLHLALPEKTSKINDQCEWVKQQAAQRIESWDKNDMRIDLLKPLLDISANDIKNAKRKPTTAKLL